MRWKREISEARNGELLMLVDHGSKCARLPILTYSVNNAADSIAIAAYVVAISPSGCHIFLHVTLLLHAVGVATWVPFFDNGKCLAKERFTWDVPQTDEFRSGRYHFSGAHFGF